MIDPPLDMDPEHALSQPTRARLFALLGELGRPAGTVELAEQLGLHPNGVRIHLERLERDGLLLRASEPRRRGRPRDVWRIAPDARPGGRAPRAYADLGRWLARAMGPSGSRGLRGVEATGREIGRELARRQGNTGEDAFQASLTALGFQPQTQDREDEQSTVRLRNCPYRDAVRENQPVICTLHRGITRGLLDVQAPGAKLAGFEPRDPEVAGCHAGTHRDRGCPPEREVRRAAADRTPESMRRASRRCRARTIDPSSPRPSALVSAFFVPAIILLFAAAGAGLAYVITGRDWLHWLALHLALLGGVSQLVLGAGQFFVCAFLATDPPSRRLIAAQLLAWNAGTLLVAVGVPSVNGLLVEVGAVLIGVGLLLFAASLYGMQRRSLQRARWAVRWYQASAGCLGLGALVGAFLARATSWSAGSLLGAHLALNLGGWLGMAIVGTLHTFFPSLTQTRLRFPVLQGPTFLLWLLGVAQLAFGAAFGAPVVVASGWLSLALAACLLAINLGHPYALRADRWRCPRN